MKILFLSTYDDPADGGGAEITIWTLMRALTARGHQCVMLSTHKGGGLERLERDGVTIWRAGIKNFYWPTKEKRSSSMAKLAWHAVDGYSPMMQGQLRAVLRIEKPDVVSVHSLPGWSATSWSTLRSCGIPFVQVLHDQYAICARSSMFRGSHNCKKQCTDCRLLRLPHRKSSNQPSAVVGVSQFILDRHDSHGYFLDVPVKRVINNTRNAVQLGLDTQAIPHRGMRFGFIGRLDPSKGVEILLQAFAKLERPDAELWIAGSGDSIYLEKLKEHTADRRVRFLGRVLQKDFFPEIDAVVVPSLWNDTFPGVVFEALAYGKPVLGSRRGGIPEMITHGENGFLFEPEDRDELAELLARLANDAELRASMGTKARETSRPFLDTDAWLQQYTELYQLVATSAGQGEGHDASA